MKGVAVTLVILIILFLSERAELSIRLQRGVSVRISLILFSIELSRLSSGNGSKIKKADTVKPIAGALGFLAANSSIKYTHVRGPCSSISPITMLLFISSAPIFWSILHNFCANFTHEELVDPDCESDSYEIKFTSQVIIYLVSLTIFVWRLMICRIRRRANNAG